MYRAALCTIGLALFAACSGNGPDAAYHHYLERLGRTLDVKTPVPHHREFPRPPRPGALQLPLTSDSLDTLDFLALSGCAVQVTIGRRNSSLGRMAAPSQRLLLELEYLRLAPACVKKLLEDNEKSLATTLDRAWQTKREQLPILIFNATLGSEEYRAFWQASSSPGGFPPVDPVTVERALAAINGHTRRWLRGDYQADNRSVELLLGEVAGGGGGRLLWSLSRQADWLAAANTAIDARMEHGPLCAPGFRHAAADVLPRVVDRFFIAGIQPDAAIMQRRNFQMLAPVEALEQLLSDVLPENFRAWRSQRMDALEWASTAPRRHVKKLKQIQAPCT